VKEKLDVENQLSTANFPLPTDFPKTDEMTVDSGKLMVDSCVTARVSPGLI
jgi:hypothetical protein